MIGIRSALRLFDRRLLYKLRLPSRAKARLSLEEIDKLGLDRTQQYLCCLNAYDSHVPQEVLRHRAYFSDGKRGFGEDAFHAMWFLLLERFRPAQMLEIGVFRGQTVSLWRLISGLLAFKSDIGCISPFSPAGDSVSRYAQEVDYFEDMLANHRHFSLAPPEVCSAYSTSPEAHDFIQSRRWNLIYIDGNHDYEVARSDFDLCAANLAPGGIIVLDDSALGTDYSPPGFATAGHPGPSKLAREILGEGFEEIFSAGHNRVFRRTN